MADTSTSIIDWEAVGKVANLDEVVRLLPPEHVIQVLGVDRAVGVIGLPRVIEAVSLPRVIEVVGLPRLLEALGGPKKMLKELFKLLPPEEVKEMFEQQQGANDTTGAE